MVGRSRVGVIGGSFDPIHMGHLVIAEEARVQLGLSRVLFVPAKNQWRKQSRALSSAEDRLAMVRAALQSNPCFEVSSVDIERDAPTYTADTLRELTGDHDLFFILGMDALLDLPHWREPETIAGLAWLVAAVRPGYELDWTALEVAVPQVRDRVLPLPLPEIGISSSAIRSRAAEGRSIRYWVPDSVMDYITARGLYR